jgi:translation initiation factor 1 (eIF-1/SUI1)
MNPFLTDTKLESLTNNTNNDPFSNNTNNDPFSNTNNTNNETLDLLKENQDIELWVSERGRKFDTYISHLPYTEAELTLHLKNLKKKLGCGGSIQNSKDFETEEVRSEYFRIHIQGNHKHYINEYFTKLGITNIRIKG